jgi:hypothetical protein
MNTKNLVFVLLISFSFLSLASTKSKKSESKFLYKKASDVTFYRTNPDKSALFEKQGNGISISSENNLPTIKINVDKT